MNREEMMNVLPHRGNMLLLDEGWLDELGVAHGRYKVRGDEWFLDGHYPGNPIVPGVVLCEIIGQASSMLFKDQMTEQVTPYYVGMDKVRFKKTVRPGDLVATTSSLIRSKLNVYVVKGEARVDGQLCSSGEFSFLLAGQEA